jgi:exosortase/archaeosortase family protein
MIGNHLAWRYKFPLVYLLFSVPMGENLIPWLQDVTAWFTVFFLKLNGIPVYVDGLYIQIPTGMFEVAVACSGIRYLIASVAVGTLFGYLTYNKFYKQILFIIFAIGLPILANGIRAYGIVAIAYYSDMEYATGADHLIYGWVFFGLVIMLMFWLGGLFADKALTKSNSTTVITAKYQYKSSIMALLIMGLSFAFIQTMPITTKPPISASALQGTKAINSDWGITFFNSLSRSHIIDDTGVEYVVAKFANRQTEGELISSNNVLFNPDRWTIVETQLNTASEPTFKFIVIRDISGHERTILFRYVIGDMQSTSKMKVKLTQAWHSLLHRTSKGYIEAVSIGNSQKSTATKDMLIKALDNFRRVD